MVKCLKAPRRAPGGWGGGGGWGGVVWGASAPDARRGNVNWERIAARYRLSPTEVHRLILDGETILPATRPIDWYAKVLKIKNYLETMDSGRLLKRSGIFGFPDRLIGFLSAPPVIGGFVYFRYHLRVGY